MALNAECCLLRVIYAECRKQAHYAECHYTECRYAKCRGANSARGRQKSGRIEPLIFKS